MTLLVTLAWALWEVGVDWWALSTRVSLLLVFGVLLVLPPMVRALHRPDAPKARYGLNSAVLAVSLIVTAVISIYTVFQNPHDVSATFSNQQMAATQNTIGVRSLLATMLKSFSNSRAWQREARFVLDIEFADTDVIDHARAILALDERIATLDRFTHASGLAVYLVSLAIN